MDSSVEDEDDNIKYFDDEKNVLKIKNIGFNI